MPALKKKVRQAKQQRAFRTSSFNSGLANSLSELLTDSRYVPEEVSAEEEDITDEFPCCFSLIEGDIQEADEEEELEDQECVIIGEKRPYEIVDDKLVPTDFETESAILSTQTAVKFWTDLFAKVSELYF